MRIRGTDARLLLAVFLFLGMGQAVLAQAGSVQRPGLPQPIGQGVNDDMSEAPGNMDPLHDERLLRAMNADRQKSLVADTNKLLRLVNELNAEIARTSPAALTADQLHRLQEIEKLAHNVKEKMSTSVRGLPAFQPPFQPVHN